LARQFTLRKKLSIIRTFSKGKIILDIGCGTGDFLNYSRGKGFTTYGVEPNEKPRKWASEHFHLDVREKLNDFSQEEIKFDCITLWHVLEHIHDLHTIMVSLKRSLSPGGIIIMALPNINSWDAFHYGKYWAAYDLPRHLYHFNPSTFELLARNNEFKLKKTLPQTLDSFYISLLSEKYLNGKTNFIKAFFFGLYSNVKATKPKYGHSSLVYILE
jgi:SAM-dependent methyltransferase